MKWVGVAKGEGLCTRPEDPRRRVPPAGGKTQAHHLVGAVDFGQRGIEVRPIIDALGALEVFPARLQDEAGQPAVGEQVREEWLAGRVHPKYPPGNAG